MEKYRITLVDAGDSAVSVRFPQEISEKIHREVIRQFEKIEAYRMSNSFPGVLDIVPSYAAILVFFDPLVTDGEAVKNELERIIADDSFISSEKDSEKRIVEIPTVYGGEYGPDLEYVAKHADLSTDDVIRLHSETLYPIYMIGFLAGFPYLGNMNKKLTTPRLDSPRLSVPAGSVGIADEQTGIYPIESPGGWQIIGRTPLDLYNPYDENPFLISAGDFIKFVPIDEQEFFAIINDKKESAARSVINTGNQESSSPDDNPFDSEAATRTPSIRILSPGPLTTIQDSGRRGYMNKGLPHSGAMDSLMLKKLNLMLGNDPGAAGLEATIMTPKIEFLQDTVFSISGFDHPILAKKGEILESFVMSRGARTYFAFSGGIDTVPMLGSRSTDIKNALGGIDGKKISAGVEIAFGKPSSALDNKSEIIRLSDIDLTTLDLTSSGPSCVPELDISDTVILYVTSGPQHSDISDASIKLFFDSEYTVSTASDRMGIRFDGPGLKFSDGKDGNIITDGLASGAIQVTPSGQPILMNADAQTTGGYSKPFWLASISKIKVAQLRPGDKVKFVLIKTADALSLYRADVSSILSK